MSEPPAQPQKPFGAEHQPDWFQRNKAIFIPATIGCAGLGCLTFVGGVIGIVLFVLGMAKDSGAYQQALTRAQEHPEVRAALGTPIEAGWYVTGNFSFEGTQGVADFAFPIEGPEGNGTIYVQATQRSGEWTFDTLVVRIAATGERIDLLE